MSTVARVQMTGLRFGRWLVLSEAGRRKRAALWLCRCNCGTERVVSGNSLRMGRSTSCGCYCDEVNRARIAEVRAAKKTHGLSHTGAYISWHDMIGRCRYSSTNGYKNYGGNGVKICERWMQFENFYADMGERPTGKTLDRYPDKNGNYEPSNCRWATPEEQRRNSNQNRVITFQGKTLCLVDWANLLCLSATSLSKRLRKWSLERALTEPSRGY